MKDGMKYAISITAYIAITLVTKRLLTWNLALLYFLTTLEFGPRTFARLRRGHHGGTAPPTSAASW